jgi:ribose 5-phosphate isomerase B
MKIAIGADHGGYHLKQEILEYVRYLGYECQDFGANTPDAVDYPDIALKVAQAVAQGKFDRGILMCGTGIGVSISANKVKGIRAALCHDAFSAHASRDHNDANILCMGGRVVGTGLACYIVKVWLETGFSQGERHVRRVGKISAAEGSKQ